MESLNLTKIYELMQWNPAILVEECVSYTELINLVNSHERN